MFNRNDVMPALILGILLPLAGFAILYQLFSLLEMWGAASGTGLSANFRERTLAIVAIALNLLPLNVYKRRRWENAMRGIVIATAILSVLWVLRYGVHLI